MMYMIGASEDVNRPLHPSRTNGDLRLLEVHDSREYKAGLKPHVAKSVSFEGPYNSFIPVRVPSPTRKVQGGPLLQHQSFELLPSPQKVNVSQFQESRNVNFTDFYDYKMYISDHLSDSSLDLETSSCPYDLRSSKLSQNPFLKKDLRKSRTKPAPYISKTYKIGKNTSLNIKMSRPMVGSLLRTRKKQKDSVENVKTKSVSNQFGFTAGRRIKTLAGFKEKKTKGVLQKEQRPFGERCEGRPTISLPIPREMDRVLTEDESEESFRTFVLETSTRPGYDDRIPKVKRLDPLLAKDFQSEFPKGFSTQEVPVESTPSDGIYKKLLPFKFLATSKGVAQSDDGRGTLDRLSVASKNSSTSISAFHHKQSDTDADECQMGKDTKTYLKKEIGSKMKASFESFFHRTTDDDSCSNQRMDNSQGGTYRVRRNLSPNANLLSNIKRSLTKVPSTEGVPTIKQTEDRGTRRPTPQRQSPQIVQSKIPALVNRPPAGKSQSLSVSPNARPKVPPRRVLRPRYSSFRSIPQGSSSPKPKKGILKKSNTPPISESDSTLPRRAVGVRYALPPSPQKSDGVDSPTSNMTESDSGLEFDLEAQEERRNWVTSGRVCVPLPGDTQPHTLYSESQQPHLVLQKESNCNAPQGSFIPLCGGTTTQTQHLQQDQDVDKVLRGWKQKYEVLLGLVKQPNRLLPEVLKAELKQLEIQRHNLVIEKTLLQSNLDSWENMGGAKGRRRSHERPESLRSLYEQVANLDCLMTSLETQIEVLTSVKEELPKEFQDTFHDSGTSGHEPDSLEAIEKVVGVGEERISPAHKGHGGGSDDGPGPGGGIKEGEAAVLLQLERCAHRQTRKSLQEVKQKVKDLQMQISEGHQKGITSRLFGSELDSLQTEQERINSLDSVTSGSSTSDRFSQEIKQLGKCPTCESPPIKVLFPSPYLNQLREMTISQLRVRVLQLEKARLDKVPLDAAKEISRLNSSMIQLEKDRDELTLQNFTLKSRLAELTSKISDPALTYQVTKDSSSNFYSKESLVSVPDPHQKLSSEVDDPEVSKILRRATYKVSSESQKVREMCLELDEVEEKYQNQICDLQNELRNQQNAATEKFDRHIRNLEDQLEKAHKKLEVTERFLLTKEEDYNMTKLDFDTLNEENRRLKDQLNDTMIKQKEMVELSSQCGHLEEELGRVRDEKQLLTEDFNRERVLRKKYYNQIEEMKGKIRVFCRLRPISEMEQQNGGDDVTTIDDDFSLTLETLRGQKTFLFDGIFGPEVGQEKIFEDTRALIQSAFDGYNVTLMAYGQTGSGKTHTMLGSEVDPGIAPRAFRRIFELAQEGRARYSVLVSAYMLELYNDRLIDLLKTTGYAESLEKLEIKRDKRGAVQVSGATLRPVGTAFELLEVFKEGMANRHTASTRMNVSSSRSHLVITVLLTVTSKQTGAVSKGKLTLVDLAGSERVQKSGVTADQLREANSINKSLSALGDVIAALASEASFIPYRNSKLTMLLQDTIGGNAKTLVFVNVSPASFNCDETLVSLMYASRIKAITNNACKNADNKEIARLKSIISKLKKGEEFEENSTL